MANIRIPCLVPKPSKHAGTSWHWQPSKTLRAAGFEPMALGKDEGKAIAVARARNAEVEAWKLGGQPSLTQPILPRRQPGTVAALIARYRKEIVNGRNEATGLPIIKPKTREAYETALKRIDTWAGKHPVAFITPARVKVLKEANLRAPDKEHPERGGIGHSATFNLLKTLRQLFAFAESCDIIPKGSNPATDFRLGAPAARSALWEAEDEAAFIAAAYALGVPGMALAVELAIYSAQREGDLIAFTEPQLQELTIHNQLVREVFADEHGVVMGWAFAQAKTSDAARQTRMEIPLEPKLRKLVEAAIKANRARDRAATPPRLLTNVLVDDRTGLPWKKRAFITAWTRILDHAATHTGRTGMRDLVWHDLRRTRVVRLRRKGMDPAMIASITGHSMQSIQMMLKVYGPVDATITAAALASDLQQEKVA